MSMWSQKLRGSCPVCVKLAVCLKLQFRLCGFHCTTTRLGCYSHTVASYSACVGYLHWPFGSFLSIHVRTATLVVWWLFLLCCMWVLHCAHKLTDSAYSTFINTYSTFQHSALLQIQTVLQCYAICCMLAGYVLSGALVCLLVCLSTTFSPVQVF